MGYIHIYTGDGKGKTTATVGLVLRALGAGKRVYFSQFMKAKPSKEIDMFMSCSENIVIDRRWPGGFVVGEPTKEQIKSIKNQFERVKKAFSKNFDIVVCDEIFVAASLGILKEEEILKLMSKKPKELELVLTGRGATQKMIQKADLVTEMKKIKHYFDKGIKAREGIEF